MKIFFAISLLLTLTDSSALAHPVTLTRDAIQKMVTTESLDIKAAESDTEAARAREGQLLRSFFPSLSFTAGQESFKIGDGPQRTQPRWGAEAAINLYNGSFDMLNERISRVELNLAESKLSQAQVDQLKKSYEIYWNSLFLQEKKSLLIKEIQKTQSALLAAQKRVSRGVAIASDRIEFELHQANLKEQLAETDLSLEHSLAELKIYLGLPSEQQVILAEVLEPVKKDSESLLFQKNYLSKIAELESEISHQEAKLVEKMWQPQLDLFVSSQRYNERLESAGTGTFSPDNQETTIGLRFIFDLGNTWNRFSEAKSAHLKAKAHSYRSAKETQLLNQDLAYLKKRATLLKNQITENKKLQEKVQLYLKLTLNDYNRGVKNSPDVVSAMDKALRTELKYRELIKEYNSLMF